MSLFVGGIFLLVFALILSVAVFGFLYRERRRQQNVKEMLQTVAGNRPLPVTKILKDALPAHPGLLDRVLGSVDVLQRSEDMLRQAGLRWTPSALFIACVASAIPGFLLGLRFPVLINDILTSVVMGALTAMSPYVYVRRCRRRRLAALEESFPEALDFLARSVRAGHAFLISLSMVSEHVPEPLATELSTLFNEINLGAPMDKAFENLTSRVPLLDYRFFTSAVMLQRQTGGNLSEILGRLAHVIRERFQLKGEVKAASAHGRLTAGILTAMPVLTALGLMVVAPNYLKSMAKDHDGRYLIVAAVIAVILGNYFIKRIIKIKV